MEPSLPLPEVGPHRHRELSWGMTRGGLGALFHFCDNEEKDKATRTGTKREGDTTKDPATQLPLRILSCCSTTWFPKLVSF